MRICSLASSGSGAFLGAGVFWEVTVIKFTGFAGTSRLGFQLPHSGVFVRIFGLPGAFGAIIWTKTPEGWGIDSGCGDVDS
jgi:hypothetical protein